VGILEEKSVMITSSGPGLGRACTDHAGSGGARLMLHDIPAATANQLTRDFAASSDRLSLTAVYVSDSDYAAALATTCRDHVGRMDSLVDNSGTYSHARPGDDAGNRLRGLCQSDVTGTFIAEYT
jgi:NADP-dependent 3-hydroxy acid dehydrogenase YdfG